MADEWVKQSVEETCVTVEESDGTSPAPAIFRVPKLLLKENEMVYVPQAISLGPYHFLKPELVGMEEHKTKVVRSITSRLPSGFFRPLEIIRARHGTLGSDNLFSKLMRCGYSGPLDSDNFFSNVMSRAGDSYADQSSIHFQAQETMAWMMFRDASFLLLFLQDLDYYDGFTY
eukprot:Gb_10238 [translate_table: standard]